jgi:hypothetical protein
MKINLLNKPIADLLLSKVVFDEYPQEKIWNNKGISLRRRIDVNPSIGSKVEVALSPENFKKYIIPVDPHAPTRCIDGRITLGWEKFDSLQQKSLGPKIPGGTAHAALTHRIINVSNIKKDLRFEKDIEEVVKRYKEVGAGFGGHVDTHQHGWNTGCGAVDNINLILEKLQRPEPQEHIRLLAKMIMGHSYEGLHIISEIIGRMLYLDALKPSYMPKEGGVPEGEFLYKKTIIKVLRHEAASNSEPVPQLAGEHGEVAIVLNSCNYTTVDTDQFYYDHGGELQVFGWDLWEMYDEAMRLYPYTMYIPFKDQQDAILKRMKHVTSRILLGIATTMVLTDGTLRVVTVNRD